MNKENRDIISSRPNFLYVSINFGMGPGYGIYGLVRDLVRILISFAETQ